MSQAGHGDYDMFYTMYTDFRREYPSCPLVESEGLYEGARSNEIHPRTITADMMRRLAYTVMQCGGCGDTYGCNGVWELQWEAGVGGIGWGDRALWDGLNLPGADQLKIFREFYESVDWHTLRPINFVAHGFSFTQRTDLLGRPLFTANDDMGTIVGYFSERSGKMATIKTLPYKSYLVRWFDPKTGEYTTVDTDARPVNGCWSLQTDRPMFAAAPEDKILVLTANK